MSIPAEVIKGKNASRLASALKKASLHAAHDFISLVHIPQQVIAVIYKTVSADKPKTFDEQERDATSTSKVRLIKYAAKVHQRLVDFVSEAGLCPGGGGCKTTDATFRVIEGVVRNKTDLLLFMRKNVITSVIAWGKAGTGKYGRKVVLQNEDITTGKAKKDRIYKLYKHHKLIEVDLLLGMDDDEGLADSVRLFRYAIAHYAVGHASGVIVQVYNDDAAGRVLQRLTTAHGFEPVYAFVKKDGAYRPLFGSVDVQYYALIDTPKSDDDKAESWAAKFAKGFLFENDLCLAGKAGYQAAKLCTF